MKKFVFYILFIIFVMLLQITCISLETIPPPESSSTKNSTPATEATSGPTITPVLVLIPSTAPLSTPTSPFSLASSPTPEPAQQSILEATPEPAPAPTLILIPPSSPAPPPSRLEPTPSSVLSPTASPLKSEPPVEEIREIKFETIKRGMGSPRPDMKYQLRRGPFLWVINNYKRTIPLLDNMSSYDRWLIRKNVNFDTEILILVFQGLTEGGWDHAIEIKRVWQQNNIINIEAFYKTLGPGPEIDPRTGLPEFHIEPWLPYHAVKLTWENIAGRENLSFRLIDASAKEITNSSLSANLRPMDPVFQLRFDSIKPLDFQFISPNILISGGAPYVNDYAKYRDPWLLILTNKSQVEELSGETFDVLIPGVTNVYDQMLSTDFERYFIIIFFGGIDNYLIGWTGDPGIDAIWQQNDGVNIIITSFQRRGPPFYSEPFLNYVIARIDKTSMISKGKIAFYIFDSNMGTLLIRRADYNIP